MSEINAAFGLLQLKHIDKAIARRKEIDTLYRGLLSEVKGIQCLQDAGEKVANYSYFPILVDGNYPISREDLNQKLKNHHIYARRYFYPLITEFPMYRGLSSAHRDNLPVATAAAQKVLCLPIYPALENAQIETIAQLIAAQ